MKKTYKVLTYEGETFLAVKGAPTLGFPYFLVEEGCVSRIDCHSKNERFSDEQLLPGETYLKSYFSKILEIGEVRPTQKESLQSWKAFNYSLKTKSHDFD